MHLTAQHVNGALAAERDWQASAGEPVPQRSAAGARGAILPHSFSGVKNVYWAVISSNPLGANAGMKRRAQPHPYAWL